MVPVGEVPPASTAVSLSVGAEVPRVTDVELGVVVRVGVVSAPSDTTTRSSAAYRSEAGLLSRFPEYVAFHW